MAIDVDIWSDFVCPFCYIGKRNLQLAVDQTDGLERGDVRLRWHAFELDPNAPQESEGTVADSVAKKYGVDQQQAIASQEQIARAAEAVELTFNWRTARPGNTFDAHRVFQLAEGDEQADRADEELKKAYFSDGKCLGDHEVLTDIAVNKIGLDREAVEEVLNSDKYADVVRDEENQAHQMGVNAVPHFVIGGKLALSGAQPPEMFAAALNRAA